MHTHTLSIVSVFLNRENIQAYSSGPNVCGRCQHDLLTARQQTLPLSKQLCVVHVLHVSCIVIQLHAILNTSIAALFQTWWVPAERWVACGVGRG